MDGRTYNSRSLEFEKYWMKLYLEYHSNPSGSEFEFIVAEAPNWAMIIPITEDGNFIMIRQYRPAWRGMSIEFPGGRADKGEEIIDAARRELLEETGFYANTIKILMSAYPVSWTTQTMSLFLAEDMELRQQDLDDEEEIEVIEMHPDDLQKRISNGEILQSTTIMAYYYWLAHC